MRNVCGLDVHKDSVFMCILKENGEKIEEKFGVLTPELDRLRDLLVCHSVGEVAMESTSIYWIPIWRVLSCDFDVKLVNPYFIKQLPGRKTDVQDAHWIATVLQKELIKGSFIPEAIIQELRQYERRIFYLNRSLQRAEQSCRTKESRFFYKYQTLSKRMNHNKALLANARKILVIIWNILSKKTVLHYDIRCSVRLIKADVIKTLIFVVNQIPFLQTGMRFTSVHENVFEL